MREDLTEPIATGRTAEIYGWENGQVVKLFHDWFRREDIDYERRISQSVYASGLPVPSVSEIIQVEGRNGLLYERIEGVSMGEKLLKKPWRIFRYAPRMAELHVEMHGKTLPLKVPDLREKLQGKIHRAKALPVPLRERVLTALKGMPKGDRLCHGDFHPGNIMIRQHKEVIIDWIDVALGNPLADLARTGIILIGMAENQVGQNPFLKAFVRGFHSLYLRHYFSLRPGGKEEYKDWLPLVAAARLSENIKELESWLITQASKINTR